MPKALAPGVSEDVALKDIRELVNKANQMISLLVHAPKCVSVIGEIIAIAAEAREEGGINLKVGFQSKYFTGNHLPLQACLTAVSNSAKEAFEEAFMSMRKIKGFLQSVPDNIKEIVDILVDASSSEEELGFVTDMISPLSKTISDSANEAKDIDIKFIPILSQVVELQVMCINTQEAANSSLLEIAAKERAVAYIEDKRKEQRLNTAQKLSNYLDTTITEVVKAIEEQDNDEDEAEVDVSPKQHPCDGDDIILYKDFLSKHADDICNFSHDVAAKKSKDGAVFVKCVLEYLLESITLQTSSFKTLFAEAVGVLTDLIANDMNVDEATKNKANDLRHKVQKHDHLSVPADPPTKLIPANAKGIAGAIQILTQSIEVLVKFQETWRSLSSFFDDLAVTLETTLATSVTSFVQKAGSSAKLRAGGKALSNAIKTIFLAQALNVSRVVFQVQFIVNSYIEMHTTYLEKCLKTLGSLQVTAAGNTVKKNKDELLEQCTRAAEELKQLVDKKVNETEESFRQYAMSLIDSA